MKKYNGALFLDVETANKEQNSICQLSFMVLNNDNKEIFSFNEYVKPFENYYHSKFEFTDIHGITWEDVKHKRKFNDVWNDIKSFFNGNYLIFAHNASFDIGCIQKAINHYNLSKPNFNYACTYLSLKKVRPDLKIYKLDHLAKLNKIKFNHHDSLEDVKTTIKIFKHYFNDLNSFLKITNVFNYEIKYF